MNIHLISVGNKMPHWVQEGYQEYAKRLPAECRLNLVEIQPGHRGKSADIRRTISDEGDRMFKAIPKNTRVIALDVQGQVWSTEKLAKNLEGWLSGGRDLSLLVGGPEGLDPRCLQQADLNWSLSKLTMPHPLVRVVLAEQLYRAWSLVRNHPYHRA